MTDTTTPRPLCFPERMIELHFTWPLSRPEIVFEFDAAAWRRCRDTWIENCGHPPVSTLNEETDD